MDVVSPEDLTEKGTRIVDREVWDTNFVEPGGSFRCVADEGRDHSEGEDLWKGEDRVEA
jgi:hypothetical protein